MSNDLIHEVEESLRRERLAALWKEHGPFLLAGAVLAVLATGMISGFRSWNERANAAQTASFLEAVDLDEEKRAKALEGLSGSLRPGQRSLALLVGAGTLLQQGKEAEALEMYRKAAADRELPADMRGLAVLQSVRVEWSLGGGDAQAMLQALQPLIDDADSPWRWHARVQAALVAHHGLKDDALARSHLGAVIEAEDAPQPLRERAKALDHVYSLSAAGNSKEPQG